MSITFGGSALVSNGGTYTVGAGVQPYLLVFCVGFDSGSGPTSVTFGGIPMVNVVQLGTVTSGSSYSGIYVYALLNPPQGSAKTISMSGALGTSVFSAAHYFGAGSVFPVYQHVNGLGNGSTVSMSITPDATTSWIISCGFDGGGAPSLSGFTSRQTSGGGFWGDSNGASGGGLYTVTIGTHNLQFYQYAEFLLSETTPAYATPGSAFITKLI